MSEQVYSIEQDLKEAEAMAESLAAYVRQDNLYGTVGGGGLFSGGRMPSLTVGALVMRLRRLTQFANQMTDAQHARFDKAIAAHEAAAREWRVHYEGKIVREANSRLDAMRTFFEECASSPAACPRIYLPEVLRRTIVEELLIAMKARGMDDPELATKARGVDSRLRRFVQPSAFVWAEALEPAYDQKQFWWMYSEPPMPQK